MRHDLLARLGAASLALLASALGTTTAHANGFDLYGAGSRATAMGGAAVSTAQDFTAVHYNPAALVLGSSSTGGGFILTFNNLGISTSPRPDGYGIPSLGTAGPAIGDEFVLNQSQSPQDLGASYAAFVGGATNLGVEKLRVGALAYVPMGNSATQLSTFNDERERLFTNRLNWDLLGGRVEHVVLEFGMAYQPVEWLALGLGASFMPSATTNNYVYADNVADLSEVDLNLELTLGSRLRPMAGVLVMPGDSMRLGITFRDEQLLRIEGVTQIMVRGLDGTDDFPFYQPLGLTMQYTPRQFVVGGSWQSDKVLVSVDLTYAVWSNYPDHHGETADFDDVFVPRIGVEWEAVEGLFVRAGAGYEPTPVGPQTGRTNYVDNDRVVTSVGTGHEIAVGDHALVVGWHLQAHALIPRDEVKERLDVHPTCAPGVTAVCDELPDDQINPASGSPWPEAEGLQTGNPGFPGWSSGGWLTNVGVDVTWLW